PSHVNKRIPRALDEIVLKCLKTSAQNRYQTIAECAAALEEARANAGDVGILTRAVKAARDNVATAISGTFSTRRGRVVLGLLVVAMVAGGYVYYGARMKLGGFGPAPPPPPVKPTPEVAVKPPAPAPTPELTPESTAIATKEQAARAEL